MTVKARFAYYETMMEPPVPSYLIVESDVWKLPKHGNVGGDQLMEAGVPLPLTPDFRTWKKMGCPIYRGEGL